MNTNSKRVAIYARISSEKQDVDLSITAQLKVLREYAFRNGYTVAREFVDEAESGQDGGIPQDQLEPVASQLLYVGTPGEPPSEQGLLLRSSNIMLFIMRGVDIST